jgi:hypothetical protein
MDLEAYVDQKISSLQEEMNYLLAVKKWNQQKRTVNTEHVWAIPRKGSKEYEEVKEISNPKPAAAPIPTPAPAPKPVEPSPAAPAKKSSDVKRKSDSEVIIESDPSIIYNTKKDKPSDITGTIKLDSDGELIININGKRHFMNKDKKYTSADVYRSNPISDILPRTYNQMKNDAGYLYIQVSYSKYNDAYRVVYYKDKARESGAQTYQTIESVFIPIKIESDARAFLKKD